MGTLTEADGTVIELINGKTYISAQEKARIIEEASEDQQIAKAQSVCKKVGLTPGTDKFIDCTIKMMSQTQSQSQGGSTIIYGQRQQYNKSVRVASGGLLC